MDDRTAGTFMLTITFVVGLFVATSFWKGFYKDYTPEHPHNVCPETMVCYEPYGAPVEAQYVLDKTVVEVLFVSKDEIPDGLDAYSIWEVDFENNLSYCVIVTQFPEQVLGDPNMDSLGHELLHCLTGEFHP